MASSNIYIPPPGLRFIIQGYTDKWAVFLHDAKILATMPLDQAIAKGDSAWCTLVHGSGDRKGQYAIKSAVRDQYLYSRKQADIAWAVGVVDGQPDNKCWFEFEPREGQYSKNFRLITPSEGVALHTPIKYNGTTYAMLGNTSSSTFEPDQLFDFVWEDMKVDKVEFKLDSGKIISSTPVTLAEQVLTNDSDTDQEMSFSVNKSITNSSTFEYSTGFTVTAGMEYSVGIPSIVEAKFKVDVSDTKTSTWGQSTTYTTQYTATFPVKARPHTSVRATSVVNQGTLEVPYTMHLSSKKAGVKVETKGVWHGVSSWDVRHTTVNVELTL